MLRMPLTMSARRWCALVLLILPAPLAAQGVPALADSTLRLPDSMSTTRSLLDGSVGKAPADSAEGPLLFLPGVTGSLAGLSIRGGPPDADGLTVNGIDVTPGIRTPWIALPTSGVRNAWAITGPLSARNAAGRALQFDLPTTMGAAGARFSYASDRLMGASSLGLNRFEASGGASTRNFRIFLAGTLTGQKSADFGSDARDVPIFVSAGTDTTVTFDATPGSGETVTTGVPQWAMARGRCDAFSSSSVPGIADNYDEKCTGDRTPGSAQSRYRISASGQYDLNPTAKLGFMVLKSRTDARNFDYASSHNPANLSGDQIGASVYAVTLSGQIGRGATPGAYRIGGSRQHNQHISSPLTPAGELKTRDPGLGLMLGGLDFAWDFESFPVDSTLVSNYRLNRQGARQSPYDLQNTSQYGLRDTYRDGPYGLYGFAESGGPVGTLALFKESRTTGFADLSWRLSRNSVFTVGGSYAKYDIANYLFQLTSQIGSDIYLEKPTSGALYAEQRFIYDRVNLSAGVRYDFFSSNAERPFALDTLQFIPGSGGAVNPTYGKYQQYPAISSYGIPGQTYSVKGQQLPLVTTRKDERHSAWSPRLRGTLRLGEKTTVRAGISREMRMPDLALVYTGVNTDLLITNTSQLFGTDLGFERTWNDELGISRQLSEHLTLDLVGFYRVSDSLPVAQSQQLRNPTRNNAPTVLLRYQAVGHFATQGAEVSLDYRTQWLSASLGYAYQDADPLPQLASWNAWSRPHTMDATVTFHAPAELKTGLLSRASLWIGFRLASGTAYSACDDLFQPLADPFTLSDEPCVGGSVFQTERLPMEKQLDLRFSKALGDAPYAPRVFIDARNALNFGNTIRTFRNADLVAAGRDQLAQGELEGLAAEAQANGAYSQSDGTIDLTFPGAGCATWVNSAGNVGAAPSCIALKRAEARYGNGDGAYTLDEQRTAVNALLDATVGQGRFGPPRRIRIGVELGI
jgi:hypothetical protein